MKDQEMGLFERFLVRVDQMPWAILFRTALGYVVVPAWAYVFTDRSEWTLLPFFLSFLIGLRLGLLVLRRLLPFSGAALTTWLQRRLMAKAYDSYQWQKLLWMGIGMSLYAAQARLRFNALLTLTVFCLLSGAIGLAMWRRSSADHAASSEV